MRGRGQRLLGYWVLGAQGRPAPYVVFGPPGTGKTMTVVEGILQVYSLSSGSCRILACAPSNSASDLMVRREREREVEKVKQQTSSCKLLVSTCICTLG